MDLPINWFGWVMLVLYLWAFAAYVTASIAGFRAVNKAYDGAVVAPMCLVADATRWVWGFKLSGHRWKPRDFLALGVFGAAIASAVLAFTTLDFLSSFDWRKLGHTQSLQRVAADILTGSSLIIFHCGVALHFKARRG
jgi:hypothetical protein